MTLTDALIGRLNKAQNEGELRNRGELWRLIHDLIVNGTASGGGGTRQIVWRPGVASVPQLDVYATWAEVYARVQALDGLIDIVCDDSTAACVVPAGTYDMTGVRLVAYSTTIDGNTVSLDDGVDLQFLRGLSGTIFLVSNSTGPVLSFGTPQIGESGPIFRLEKGATIYSNTVPMIRWDLAGGRGLTVFLENFSTFGDTINPVLDLLETGAANFFIDFDSVLFDESVAGTVDAQLIEFYESGAGLPGLLSLFSGTVVRLPYPPVPIATYFVEPIVGSDTRNDGSEAMPFATPDRAIQEGITNSSGRFTVVLLAGSYGPITIPTAPGPSHLTIEGRGSPSNVIVNGGGGAGLSLLPAPVEEGGIRNVTVRNLTLDGDYAIRAEGLGASASFFLDEGLNIENCLLFGASAAIFAIKCGKVNIRDTTSDGGMYFIQCGGGRWTNVVQNEFMLIEADLTNAALPINGVFPFHFIGCDLTDVNVDYQAKAIFDPSTTQEFLACQAVDNADPMFVQCEARIEFSALAANVDDPITAPPRFNFDRCWCNNFECSGFVVPTTSVEVSAESATFSGDGGFVSIGGRYTLHMRGAKFQHNLLSADPGGLSACARDRAYGAIPAGAGPDAITLQDFGGSALPFPAGSSYTVLCETTAAVAVAISAKTVAGFTVTKAAATAGEYVAVLQ